MTWTTWDAQPTDAVIEAHVRTFFDAIRANDGAAAFALCPHQESSKPYFLTPDKKSIAAAMKLVTKCLTDNKLVAEATGARERIGVAAVKVDGISVYAKIAIDGAPTRAVGLFRIVQHDDRWQLAFAMLRIFPSDPFGAS